MIPDSVETIVGAIENDNYAAAYTFAMDEWRRHRSAVLADLIDAITKHLLPTPIAGRDKATFQRAWLAAAKLPDHMGALAEGLGRNIPIRDVNYFNKGRDVKRHRDLLDRIAALGRRDADPRSARALVELVVRAPFSVDHPAGVYGPVIAQIVELGDERSIAALGALVARPIAKTQTVRNYLAEALPVAIAELERGLAKRPPLRPRDRATLTKLLATLVGPAPVPIRPAADLDALLAECLANPADEAPRLVYADALLEAGDPRGELIQLQLRDGEPSETDAKRVASLLRKHDKEWLGDLARVTKLRVWRRGFLAEAELLQGAAAEPKAWASIAKDPRLATVTTLVKGSASEELYRSFVFSKAMKSLRDIEVPSSKMLRDLPTIGRALDAIRIPALSKDAIAVLGSIAAATGVRRLAFETTQTPAALLAQVEAWADRARFDELTALPKHRVSDAWVAGDLEWLFAFERLGIKRLGFGDDRDHNRLVLTRTKRGVEAEIVANQEWLVVRLLSRKLPLPVTKLVVRGKTAPWFPPGSAFKRAIAKLPASAVELREGWASVSGRGRPGGAGGRGRSK